ncbi:unnamed protein product [Ilex paraguariensis]|uniref:Uncharacterized protein n=1 Tax=Ilex paraguariensis TaxID=185542 RepID=A0ABC8UD55_9AQUA
MGNCIETCKNSQQVENQKQQNEEEEEEDEDKTAEFEKENGFQTSGTRIKIVLTKEELGWLLLQLKEKGGKRLEDVLEEIERSRSKVSGWKPSLESIMESPEVLEMDRS